MAHGEWIEVKFRPSGADLDRGVQGGGVDVGQQVADKKMAVNQAGPGKVLRR